MKQFIKGKKLSGDYYREVIKKLINVPHSATLIGEGSEVLGYDQPRSTYHNWGPRVTIFVQKSQVKTIRNKIIETIPSKYKGYQIKYYNSDTKKTQTNVEVTTLNKWLEKNLKINNIDKISTFEWLAFPQQHLLQFVAGEVFNDDLGELTHAKNVLSWYPRDIWLWIMACQWHFIGVNEPFVERTLEAGDTLGSQLVINKLIRYIMEMWFLQNKVYYPYDKWFGTAFGCLPKNEELKSLIWSTLKEKDIDKQLDCLHKLIIILGRKHNELGISTPIEPRYSDFEVGINNAVRPYKVFNAAEYKEACLNSITNVKLKKLIWIGAFDQLTHSDDLLINFTDWSDKIKKNYEQELGL